MTSKFSIDGETVRKLAEILVETDLTEIEVEDNGCKIYVSRRQNITQHVVAGGSAPMVSAPVAQSVAPAPSNTPATAPSPADHPGAIKSPMVGMVYMAPEPGASPFVKVGDTVAVGQTLLIVEAMKVMNPIKSSMAGKVTQILAQDAHPVEFDQVLLIIE
jgi:acetyl-CoA carboxylase biotin carboxyl carrier protein